MYEFNNKLNSRQLDSNNSKTIIRNKENGYLVLFFWRSTRTPMEKKQKQNTIRDIGKGHTGPMHPPLFRGNCLLDSSPSYSGIKIVPSTINVLMRLNKGITAVVHRKHSESVFFLKVT